MSNEKSQLPLSKATNVAEKTSKECNVTFEVSKNEVSDDQCNQNETRGNVAEASSMTKKKPASKKKGGPSITMLNIIKAQQNARLQAEIEAAAKAAEDLRTIEKAKQEKDESERLKEEDREKKKEKEKQRIERKKQEGTYQTKGQREKYRRAQIQLGQSGIHVPSRHQSATSTRSDSTQKRMLYEDHRKKDTIASDTLLTSAMIPIVSENDDMIEKGYSSTDSWADDCEEDNTKIEVKSGLTAEHENQKEEDEDENDLGLTSLERVRRRLERYHDICESHRTIENLRAPVICVLGHVDAGKTTILDNLRRTHVQDDEAGGITQQIGATNVPLETILERIKMCRKIITRQGDLLVPGLSIIDTPGHAIFDNLRARGSSLCDLAILVVDIMKGIQPQTIESIRLLTEKQTPFIIALNKIDLLYDWKGDRKQNVEYVLEKQNQNTQYQFEKRCNYIIGQFAEQCLNVALYNKNPDSNEYYSMVPTSARSGDGMGSLIAMIIEKCQTTLAKHIAYSEEVQATVLEVKTIRGFGTTLDVVLIDGCLCRGDKIIIAGQEGPITTQIRVLLVPELNQDIRMTTQYKDQEKVTGACSIKIVAKDLEKSLAGLPLFVIRKQDEIDYYTVEIQRMITDMLNLIQLEESGVYVQTSTFGSLEAFLKLLKTHHIPCAGVNIGPVHRKDIMRASTQLEKDKQWACLLVFDVKIEPTAQEYAKTLGLRILQSDGVYNLCDMFLAYQEEKFKEKQEKHRHLVVYPCKLRILWNHVYNTSNPIICGVRVEDGFVKIGTPICVPSKDNIDLGRIVGIKKNDTSVEIAEKGSEVSIKIEAINREELKMYGRHFDHNDLLISKISRESIDILKAYFRQDMKSDYWKLVIELKKLFHIV
ncbi:hypothetical protein I4U23_026350 [Adineta vaga]|nr:hypothetical protein I4U23_026350 [Adineta vaga]